MGHRRTQHHRRAHPPPAPSHHRSPSPNSSTTSRIHHVPVKPESRSAADLFGAQPCSHVEFDECAGRIEEIHAPSGATHTLSCSSTFTAGSGSSTDMNTTAPTRLPDHATGASKVAGRALRRDRRS
uniref:Uncharacterized protein n=1 Tax=Rhodococcus sp. NS1 TaxID=402236 RepID=A0A097SR10_9NOCA|nr:hypothetical protein LRS1606.530 [Rhodococcus sp. NS1]